MHTSSKIFYTLLVLVIITFSWIVIPTILKKQPVHYFSLNSEYALVYCLAVLSSTTTYNRVIDKITLDIESDWLQGLFRNFLGGMLILNQSGHILFANQNALTFFGLTHERIVNQDIANLFNNKAAQFYLESIQEDESFVWKEEFQLENEYKRFAWYY